MLSVPTPEWIANHPWLFVGSCVTIAVGLLVWVALKIEITD